MSRIQPLDKIKTANILKQLRLESGYNKEEVSGLMGISPASLRHYEEGKNISTLRCLISYVSDIWINYRKIIFVV